MPKKTPKPLDDMLKKVNPDVVRLAKENAKREFQIKKEKMDKLNRKK